MLGNRVEVELHTPNAFVHGELRNQTDQGVWIFSGYGDQAALRFYPMYRIILITDQGPVTR